MPSNKILKSPIVEPIGLLKNRKFAIVTSNNETKIFISVLLLNLILLVLDMFLPFALCMKSKHVQKWAQNWLYFGNIMINSHWAFFF